MLSRVDPEQGTVASATAIGASPRSVAAGKGVVWVTHAGGRLTEVDGKSGAPVHATRLGGPLGQLAVGAGALYVAVPDWGLNHRGGTLELVGGDVLDSLDPGLVYSPAGWRLMSVIGDGLVGYRRVGGTGGDLVPDLARSLPTVSEGGRTLSFQLRRGLRYSNGAAVRANDHRTRHRALVRHQRPARPGASTT